MTAGGMHRRELARYHDIAASTKLRGEGIGFAGVGIKLGLLVSSEVIEAPDLAACLIETADTRRIGVRSRIGAVFA